MKTGIITLSQCIGIRTLFTASTDGMQVEKNKWENNNLAEINVMLVVISTSLIIHILCLKWFDNCAKYEMTEMIGTLERYKP